MAEPLGVSKCRPRSPLRQSCGNFPRPYLLPRQRSSALSAPEPSLTTIDEFTTALAKDPRVDYVYSIATLLKATVGEVSPAGLQALEQDPAAASYLAQTVNVDDGFDRTIITVVSKAPIDSTEATDLVRDLRDVGFVQTFLPIMVFALVFGLSMDYEVFLMGRMREHWLLTHDNDEALVAGVAHTARVITAAALIMAAVFGCFLVADVLELKEFGFALATAVVLDATIVRLLLVPAIMKVAGGGANWWLPGWLDRVLPRIRVD